MTKKQAPTVKRQAGTIESVNSRIPCFLTGVSGKVGVYKLDSSITSGWT